jgi:hypothetical protein
MGYWHPLTLGKYKLEIDAYDFVLKNPIALAVGVSRKVRVYLNEKMAIGWPIH